MTPFKKYVMPIGLVCLLSAIIPVTHFISDYFYSAEQGIREWADQAVEEQNDALSYLAYYLRSDGKEKLFDHFQQNLELLKQRRHIYNLIFESTIPIDTVVSKELSRGIASGQQYAAVFLLRSFKEYAPVRNTRQSWQ